MTEKRKQMMLDNLNINKLKNFFEKYDYVTGLKCDVKYKTYIGDKSKRVCRFCGKTKPEVGFRKDAHIIPECLGNKKLLSYFECDSCNDKFSKYEDALNRFIGALRPFAFLKGKKKEIIFKDSRTDFKIVNRGNIIYVYTMLDKREENIKIDEVNKLITLSGHKQSYIPIHVYKIFVKICLSILPEHELVQFEKTKNFLLLNADDDKMFGNPFCKLFYYFILGQFKPKIPEVSVYKLKKEYYESSYPERTMIMVFGNLCGQIFMPFNEKDKHMYSKEGFNIDFTIFPLLVDHRHFLEFGDYSFCDKDLSSSEILRSSSDIITLNSGKMEEITDPEILKSL